MKLKYLAIALFPLALAACQSSDIQKVGDLAVSVLQQQNTDQTLANYHWSANTADAPKPLILNFDKSGRLSISTSCNGMGTNWKIENNQIVTGNLMATQMACAPNAMAQEKAAAKLFDNRKAPFVLNLNDPEAPTLTVMSASGEKVIFTGKQTAESKYQSQGETIFLEISPETKTCSTGVARIQCLQVREIKYAENGVKTQVDQDWSLFYDHIDGYTHDPKTRQIVRVKRYERQNPAADQSKYAYVKDLVVETETVK